MSPHVDFRRLLLAILVSISLGACVPHEIGKGGPGTLKIGANYEVTANGEWSIWELDKNIAPVPPIYYRNRWPLIAWEDEVRENSQIWTRRGYILQELGFINGIRAEKEIVGYFGDLKALRFKSDMTDSDVTMLVSKLLRFGNLEGFEIPPLNRVQVGGKEAIHFVASYIPVERFQHGLEYKTAVYVFVEGDQLNFIYFTAPALLYFDKDWPEAQEIIRSVRFNPARK